MFLSSYFADVSKFVYNFWTPMCSNSMEPKDLKFGNICNKCIVMDPVPICLLCYFLHGISP